MREALALAEAASAHGDVPVGALVVDADGAVIGRGMNRREVDRDPLAHAEIEAIRQASRSRAGWRLDGCTLIVTLEPCPMCAGALVNARIARCVFGSYDPKAGAAATLYAIPEDPRLNHRTQVVGGVLGDESAALLSQFFADLRRRRSGSS
jgi:tRNA(adenine34) deaminase